MSRERTDTAGSNSSYGLRERTHTGGSMDLILETAATTNSSSPYTPRSRINSTGNKQQSMSNSSSLPFPPATPPKSKHKLLRSTVDWLQKQPVPTCCLPYLKKVVGLKRSNSNIAMGHHEQPEDFHHDVYLIRGLDRVVFGTTAAADCVVIAGIQPPRYLFYMVSGAACDILQLLIDVTLHLTVFPNDASLCWMTSFVASIAARHTSHRYLVFGDYVPHYWASLRKMYAGYSISIVLSTIFNYFITTGVAPVSHYVAYVFTLLWTGLANYFILKRLWKMGGNTTNNNASSSGTTAVSSSATSSTNSATAATGTIAVSPIQA